MKRTTFIENEKVTVFEKLDYYSVMLYKYKIRDVLKKLYVESYEDDFMDSVRPGHVGPKDTYQIYFNGIKIDVMANDYLYTPEELVIDTIFPTVRVEIFGSGLDYLRSNDDIHIDQMLMDPHFWSDDPQSYNITRCDFAFDFVNYKPHIIDQLYEFTREMERLDLAEEKAYKRYFQGTVKRLNCGNGGGLSYEYHGGNRSVFYIGKGKSGKMLRIYDKYLELANSKTPIPDHILEVYPDVTSIIRFELQTRERYAADILFNCHGDLDRVLSFIYESFAVRGRDNTILDFVRDFYDWQHIERTIQNINYIDFKKIEDIVQLFPKRNRKSILGCIAYYGLDDFLERFNSDLKYLHSIYIKAGDSPYDNLKFDEHQAYRTYRQLLIYLDNFARELNCDFDSFKGLIFDRKTMLIQVK